MVIYQMNFLFAGGEIMTVTERTDIEIGLNLAPGPDLSIDQSLVLVHVHALKGRC